MKPDELDRVFSALAHPHRRRMLDIVREAPGLTIADLARHFAMSAVGVLKHVRVLEAAELVVSQRHGRERRLHFNPVPIQMVYDRWTDEYSQFWSARIADLKQRLEGPPPTAGAVRAGGGGRSKRRA